MNYEYIENDILKVYFDTRQELNDFIINCDMLHHTFNLDSKYWNKYPEIKEQLANYEPVPFDYRFHRTGESSYVIYVGYSGKYVSENRTNDIIMTEDALQYPDFFSSTT